MVSGRLNRSVVDMRETLGHRVRGAPEVGGTMGTGIVEAVREILPIVDAHRDEADAAARMAAPVVRAAHSAGVFRLFALVECGGPGATFAEILQVFEDIGWADPTVAWHAGNSAAIGFAAAFIPQDERSVPFDGTTGPFGFSVVQGGTLEPTAGGYRVSGRWPFLTGALDAPWAAINAVVNSRDADRSPPDVRLCLVPQEHWTVERTWVDAVAMRGTGSHAIEVHDAFVSEAFAHSWLRPKLVDEPIHRLPTAVTGPVTNSAIAVGITRRAVDEVTRIMAAKVSRADGQAVREKIRMQRDIAAASAEVAILHAGLQDMAEEVWAAALVGRPSSAVRGRMWATSYVTLDRCRDLVGLLATQGTSALYSRRNPVEAALRDIHAICAAMETWRDLQEAHGRVLLGLPAGHIMF